MKRNKIVLADLRKELQHSAPYSKPNNFGPEGVDHININAQSNLMIGKMLDPVYVSVFHYKHIGRFASVMGLWYWLRSEDQDDVYRQLVAYRLKRYADSKSSRGNYVPNFKAIIAKATWMKIKDNRLLREEIKKLDPTIALISYYSIKSSNVRICTNYAYVIVDIATEMIKAVKEDREPDFNLFVDKPRLATKGFLEGFLQRISAKIEDDPNVTDEEVGNK